MRRAQCLDPRTVHASGGIRSCLLRRAHTPRQAAGRTAANVCIDATHARVTTSCSSNPNGGALWIALRRRTRELNVLEADDFAAHNRFNPLVLAADSPAPPTAPPHASIRCHTRVRRVFLAGPRVGRGAGETGEPAPAFNADARPIFQDVLHRVPRRSREAQGGLDLRLSDSALKGGKNGPAIVEGKPDESLLLDRA